jgi:hypothetical protein
MTSLFSVQNTSGYATVQLTGDNIAFNTLTVWGYKSFVSGAPTNNSFPAYVGLDSNFLPIQVSGATPFTLTLPNRQFNTLSNVYVRCSSGDGVYALVH